MIIKLFFILIAFSISISGQIFTTSSGFLRDTSFTIYSSYEKEKKSFPFIKIVDADTIYGTEVDSNLVYSSLYGRDLHLDLYSSEKNNSKLPVVLLIHGGGWRSGDRHQQAALAKMLALNGFLAATIEFRLSPEAKYPAAIYDIKTAIRMLKHYSTRFDIDTNKIAILGCSSGGHLASFIGATNGVQRFEGDGEYLQNSSDVHAIINLDGILDFTHPGESAKDTDITKPSVGKLWLGFSYAENPELWIEASSLTYMGANTAPILFVNSEFERFHAGRNEAINILKKHNIYTEVHTINDCPHTFWLFQPWFKITCSYIINFLNKMFNH